MSSSSKRTFTDGFVETMTVANEKTRQGNQCDEIIEQRMRPVRGRCVWPATICSAACKPNLSEDGANIWTGLRNHQG